MFVFAENVTGDGTFNGSTATEVSLGFNTNCASALSLYTVHNVPVCRKGDKRQYSQWIRVRRGFLRDLKLIM